MFPRRVPLSGPEFSFPVPAFLSFLSLCSVWGALSKIKICYFFRLEAMRFSFFRMSMTFCVFHALLGLILTRFQMSADGYAVHSSVFFLCVCSMQEMSDVGLE